MVLEATIDKFLKAIHGMDNGYVLPGLCSEAVAPCAQGLRLQPWQRVVCSGQVIAPATQWINGASRPAPLPAGAGASTRRRCGRRRPTKCVGGGGGGGGGGLLAFAVMVGRVGPEPPRRTRRG